MESLIQENIRCKCQKDKTGAVAGIVGAPSLLFGKSHKRRISLDPRYLAQATPEQMLTLKDNLVSGVIDEKHEGIVILETS